LAQSHPTHQDIDLWFQEERFIIADQNDDALLDQSEMKRFSSEFSYYLEPRHYQLTDKNQDGLLSFNEMLDRSHSEKIYRFSQEQRELRDLAHTYPLLAQADAKYLKARPELVRSLFGNLLWLSDHQKLVESLYGDRFWSSQNAEVLLVLHRNLRWMAANPNGAKALYRDRSATQYLPELLSWRADHKDFIHKHPRLDDFYRSAFFPGGISNY
jgi:hypothetical protein